MSGARQAAEAGTFALDVEVAQDAPIPLHASFTVRATDVLAVFGPSGAGKTTLLRTIAGLHRATHAVIRCADRVWADTRDGTWVATSRRRVGYVPQDYALFPHLDAQRNVETALGDLPRAERAAEARRWLAAVHLAGLEDRRPADLSGGQQQRVALARALARRPDVLLLDEPFAGADAALRARLHDELDALRRTIARPVVLVTHSMADVRRLATHMLVLVAGRTVAAGPLTALSTEPGLGEAVAPADVGSVLETRVTDVDTAHGLATCAFDGGTVIVAAGRLAAGQRARVHVPARDVILATARPERVSLHNVLAGTVLKVASLDAARVLVQVGVGGSIILAEITRDAVERLQLRPGLPVFALVKSVSLTAHPSPA
jgi:molybdate transport system ATP-binding protein